MCTNLTVFLQEENEVVDMCTHFLFFFRRRKIADMCPNFLFFQEVNADMCTNVLVFIPGGECDCRHVYNFFSFSSGGEWVCRRVLILRFILNRRMRMQTCVLILWFFFRGE